MTNTITSYTINGNVLMAFREDGSCTVFTKKHPDFNRVRLCLLKGDTEGALRASKTFAEVVAADSNFRIDGDSVSYKGREVPRAVAERVVAIFSERGDLKPFERFMDRLAANPSSRAANELYDFMLSSHLPLTENGTVLAYKGVQDDFWSVSGNLKTRVIRGEVNDRGQILNLIGETIEVARQDVDDNREHECSWGLHVGAQEYASTFAPKMVMVEFDPADAVSVPKDHGCKKLRVSRYKVLKEVPNSTFLKRQVYDSIGDDDIEIPSPETMREYADKLVAENKGLHDVSELYAYLLSTMLMRFGDEGDVEQVVKDTVKAEQVRRESETEEEFDTATLEPFDARVKRYLDRKAPCTVRKLANSFSPQNPDMDVLVESAREVGYKVTPTGNGKSQWLIHRSYRPTIGGAPLTEIEVITGVERIASAGNGAIIFKKAKVWAALPEGPHRYRMGDRGDKLFGLATRHND